MTATLAAGNFANGTGNLTYSLSGTPDSEGTASFALNIGGQTCNLNVNISSSPVCRAKINATTYRNFMCHNLGAANTSADPFTPSWEINGGYWQWGRKEQAVAGPSGPGPDQANEAAVSGWNTNYASNGSWSDFSKTANDPCPAGHRVPTKAYWDGIFANNSFNSIGTWSFSSTNYSSGIMLGNELFLPAAGYREYSSGELISRGYYGDYWTSSESGTNLAWYVGFNSGEVYTSYFSNGRTTGFPIRCIEDIHGSIGSLDCNGTTITGSLFAGFVVSNVNTILQYSGGNGESYSGQTASSTGVTGLTATLSPGIFAVGNGSLTYTITGTPGSAGTASFAINIGGQSCNLEVNVAPAPICRAKIDATTYKNFMCHNLGAANTNADPFTPSWEINGGYWQWGRKEQAAAGPSGPGANQANESAVSGWNENYAPNNSWLDDYKTSNDPCPSGFRVPTRTQWNGVIANNILSNIGTWLNSPMNYSSGKKFGAELFLPAAGYRNGDYGTLNYRSYLSYYWCSTEGGTNLAAVMFFEKNNAITANFDSSYGVSLRCIEE